MELSTECVLLLCPCLHYLPSQETVEVEKQDADGVYSDFLWVETHLSPPVVGHAAEFDAGSLVQGQQCCTVLWEVGIVHYVRHCPSSPVSAETFDRGRFQSVL